MTRTLFSGFQAEGFLHVKTLYWFGLLNVVIMIMERLTIHAKKMSFPPSFRFPEQNVICKTNMSLFIKHFQNFVHNIYRPRCFSEAGR